MFGRFWRVFPVIFAVMVLAQGMAHAQFVKDTFTGTAGTAIVGGHTGEIGATWTLDSAVTDNGIITTSPANYGRFTTSGNANVGILASGSPPNANYDVQADFLIQGSVGSRNWGVKARSNGTNTFYYAIYQNSGAWNLYKVVSGTQTNLATASFTPSVGHTYTVRLRAQGTTVQMFYSDNGGTFTQVGSSATDSAVTGAGVTGIYGYAVGNSDSSGVLFKNFVAASTLTTFITAPVMSLGSGTASSQVINWTASLGGQPGYTYAVQRAPDVAGSPGTFSTLSGAGSLSTLTYTDTTVVTGTKYWYQVVATDSTSGSANTNTSNDASITISGIATLPSLIPANHNGNITISLTGSGTSWVSGTTVFALTGGSGYSKVSQTVTSTTAGTIVISVGAVLPGGTSATGPITVSDGTLTGTITVGVPSLTINPTTGSASTTPALTLTGTNTIWSSETAAGLFTVTGGTGSSIATPTVSSNTAATAVLTAGSAAGALTITDASTGATATFTVSASSTTIPVGDSHIYWSPLGTYSDGTGSITSYNVHGPATGTGSSANVIWNSTGNYFKTVLSNSSSTFTPSLLVSESNLGVGNSVTLGWTIDGGPLQYTVCTSSTTSVVLNGTPLSAGVNHALQLWFTASSSSGALNSWTSLNIVVDIQGISVATGTVTSAPTIFSSQAILLGDSFTRGNYDTILPQNGQGYYGNFLYTYAPVLFSALQMEYGVAACGGQGWNEAGQLGWPTFHTVGTTTAQTWRYHDSAHSRISGGKLEVIPTAVFVMMGTNDAYYGLSTTGMKASITDFISHMRGCVNTNTPIWLMVPFGQYIGTSLSTYGSAIETAVTTAGDNLARYLDPTYVAGIGLSYNSESGATAYSSDGLHPNLLGHARGAALLVQAYKAATSGRPQVNGGFVH